MTAITSGHQVHSAPGFAQEDVAVVEDAAEDETALHERLVAYVHALSGSHDTRSGVWVEHSYARARGASAASAAHVRVLPAPRATRDDPDIVDVERLEPAPPAPFMSRSPPLIDDDDEDDEPDDRWERAAALAPTAAHARLAAAARDALRRLRLASLAGARLEATREAARRLRLALAAAAPARPRPGPWLHAALAAHLGRGDRALYEATLAELRRTAPRAAERLTGARAAAAPEGPARGVAPPAAPCLLWLGGERWARRLSSLLRVRRAPAPAVPGPPDAWCAGAAAAARAALHEALHDAGGGAVVVGGSGGGAALATLLAAGGGVRGLLLLAPPLLTAEGARDGPDDPLAEVAVPVLMVAGTGAATSWRGAARAVCRAPRRLLELRGADDALRLPHAQRARRALPQRALDAAVAEECARWVLEVADGSAGDASPPRERERPRRRGGGGGEPDGDEYAHLPSAAPASDDRSIEIVEGRVVSRGCGATPLALLPPRRSPPLAAADIMQLPIVFADDEPPPPADGVTVTSGSARARRRYTRVIVAKRGAPALLLRRQLRVLPQHR